MKKSIIALAAASFAVLTPAAASAAVVDLSAVSGVNTNIRIGDTDQIAVALDVNVGSVVDSAVDNSANNLINTSLIDAAVNQIDAPLSVSLANISFVDIDNLNASFGPVTQTAIAGSGTGSLLRSNLSNNAFNGINTALFDFSVKQ